MKMIAMNWQKFCRRVVLGSTALARMRTIVWRLRGAKIGPQTLLPKGTSAIWPHQVELGKKCVLQPDIFFNYDHYWVPGPSIVVRDGVFIGRGCEFNIRKKIIIGNGALIASGCTFIDHDHGRDPTTGALNDQCPGAPIEVGEGAWVGAKCTILKGVRIGRNSAVGAGSVVTKSVPDGEIWAGIPACRLPVSS
jgi:serine acetyltransferase